MRFGRHSAPAEETAWDDLWAVSPEPVTPAPVAEDSDGRELFVRHARKDGKLVAMLRAVDHGSSVSSRQRSARTAPRNSCGPARTPSRTHIRRARS